MLLRKVVLENRADDEQHILNPRVRIGSSIINIYIYIYVCSISFPCYLRSCGVARQQPFQIFAIRLLEGKGCDGQGWAQGFVQGFGFIGVRPRI